MSYYITVITIGDKLSIFQGLTKVNNKQTNRHNVLN